MANSAQYIATIAQDADLKELHPYIEEILGTNIISFKQFVSKHQKNKNSYHTIKKFNGQQPYSIKGFLAFSFLTKEALAGLQSKVLHTLDLDGEHLVADGEQAHGIYLGAVGACPEEKDARRATMKYLFNTTAQYRQEFECPFLLKPVTEAGMKIAKSFETQPMHAKSGLGQMYISYK
jgi:hypothetical protein